MHKGETQENGVSEVVEAITSNTGFPGDRRWWESVMEGDLEKPSEQEQVLVQIFH